MLTERADRVVVIESKCTEYLTPHTARFSQSYRTGMHDARRRSSWYQEMLRLIEAPKPTAGSTQANSSSTRSD